MKAKVGFVKRALILGSGLLMGTAGFALAPGPARADDSLIGIHVGPLHVGVGVGSSESDDVAPAPAPAPPPPVTYVAPSTTTVEEAPPSDVAPAPAPPAPVATSGPSTTTETTTYYGQGEPNGYPGYDPGLVPKGSETTKTYYPPQ